MNLSAIIQNFLVRDFMSYVLPGLFLMASLFTIHYGSLYNTLEFCKNLTPNLAITIFIMSYLSGLLTNCIGFFINSTISALLKKEEENNPIQSINSIGVYNFEENKSASEKESIIHDLLISKNHSFYINSITRVINIKNLYENLAYSFVLIIIFTLFNLNELCLSNFQFGLLLSTELLCYCALYSCFKAEEKNFKEALYNWAQNPHFESSADKNK